MVILRLKGLGHFLPSGGPSRLGILGALCQFLHLLSHSNVVMGHFLEFGGQVQYLLLECLHEAEAALDGLNFQN